MAAWRRLATGTPRGFSANQAFDTGRSCSRLIRLTSRYLDGPPYVRARQAR